MNEALAQNTRANLLPGFLYEGVTLTPDLESEFLYKGAILAPDLQIYYIIYFFLCQVIPIRKYAEDVSVLYVTPLLFMPVQTYLQAFLRFLPSFLFLQKHLRLCNLLKMRQTPV